jgi:mono/diheme cytochrome c family protein
MPTHRRHPRLRPALAAAVLVALGLAAASFAATPVTTKKTTTAKTTTVKKTTTKSTAKVVTIDGKALFKANCGACHRLAGAGTSGHVGPNLDYETETSKTVVYLVTNGDGVMPGFGGTLTTAQILAVANFVATATTNR